MGLLIDSSVLIAAERGKIDLGKLINQYSSEPTAISAVSASELLHGIHRAQNIKRTEQRRSFVEYLLSTYTIIPFDLDAARQHARIWAMMQASGTMIGAHDLLIAATALAISYSVVTLNITEFTRVPSLRVIGPNAPMGAGTR